MEYIAVLGRREEPTDGVEDYCRYLGEALAEEGVDLQSIRVSWADIGWPASGKKLSASISGKKEAFFLLQYTALAWSRRGFSMRAVGVLKALKTNGARCAVVFHDPDGYAGNRIIDYVRRTLQRRTMRRLSQLSDAAIFTLPLEKISWLPPGAPNVFYIPVGANLPAPEQAWKPLRNQTGEKPIVAIFSLSDQPIRALEVRTIAEAVTYAAKQVGPLQVRLMGRNSETGGEELRAQLSGTSVDVTSLGLLAAEDVVKALGSSDAMLFPRGSISTRRGSAIAGVACGLPVIAQDGSEVAAPVTQAGIALVPENSPKDFGPVLTRVLTDHAYRASLEERSRNAQATYFNWSVIAKQYVQALRMATDS